MSLFSDEERFLEESRIGGSSIPGTRRTGTSGNDQDLVITDGTRTTTVFSPNGTTKRVDTVYREITYPAMPPTLDQRNLISAARGKIPATFECQRCHFSFVPAFKGTQNYSESLCHLCVGYGPKNELPGQYADDQTAASYPFSVDPNSECDNSSTIDGRHSDIAKPPSGGYRARTRADSLPRPTASSSGTTLVAPSVRRTGSQAAGSQLPPPQLGDRGQHSPTHSRAPSQVRSRASSSRPAKVPEEPSGSKAHSVKSGAPSRRGTTHYSADGGQTESEQMTRFFEHLSTTGGPSTEGESVGLPAYTPGQPISQAPSVKSQKPKTTAQSIGNRSTGRGSEQSYRRSEVSSHTARRASHTAAPVVQRPQEDLPDRTNVINWLTTGSVTGSAPSDGGKPEP